MGGVCSKPLLERFGGGLGVPPLVSPSHRRSGIVVHTSRTLCEDLADPGMVERDPVRLCGLLDAARRRCVQRSRESTDDAASEYNLHRWHLAKS